jgi:hypothetical protein
MASVILLCPRLGGLCSRSLSKPCKFPITRFGVIQEYGSVPNWFGNIIKILWCCLDYTTLYTLQPVLISKPQRQS